MPWNYQSLMTDIFSNIKVRMGAGTAFILSHKSHISLFSVILYCSKEIFREFPIPDFKSIQHSLVTIRSEWFIHLLHCQFNVFMTSMDLVEVACSITSEVTTGGEPAWTRTEPHKVLLDHIR